LFWGKTDQAFEAYFALFGLFGGCKASFWWLSSELTRLCLFFDSKSLILTIGEDTELGRESGIRDEGGSFGIIGILGAAFAEWRSLSTK